MTSPGRPPGSTGLSPKAKLALKAVILGGLKHKQAAQIADIHPAYVTVLKNSPDGKAYCSELEADLTDRTIETSSLLSKLGREAVERIATLMRHSNNEAIQLRASQDLADRAPGTQKIQKHQVESFSINSRDAQAIADAMVESARVKRSFGEVLSGDYIRVPIELPSTTPDDAPETLAQEPAGPELVQR